MRGQTIDETPGAGCHYVMDAACANCGWQGYIRLPFGCHAPTGRLGVSRRAQCPACGCREVTAGKLARPS